ncbi:MAG: fibronectin type III domain-containing protein [Thermoplasmata archaeon]|nr:fibronectin type III domain-containing protein [Thermoplasmata archaeon]
MQKLFGLLAGLLALQVSLVPVGATSYHTITCDGEFDDWALDEYLGTSGNTRLYFTFDTDNLYFGFDRGSADNDIFVAMDTLAGGTATSVDWHGTHTLPFDADYFVCIESESYAAVRRWNGSAWQDVYSLLGYGFFSSPDIEFRIPRLFVGNPAGIKFLAYGQWEDAINVWAAWPTRNVALNNGAQQFSYYYEYNFTSGISPGLDQPGNLPPTAIKVDGYNAEWTAGLKNFHIVVDSSEDSAADVTNIVDNEVLKLYYAWDDNYLYLSYDYITGYWGGDNRYDNGTLLVIDASTPENDGTPALSTLNVWQRQISFKGFTCEFIYGKWDDMAGYFYHVQNSSYAEDITYRILKGETGGAKVNGAVELAIPWFVLYGENYTRIFPSVSIKFLVCVVGVDGTNAADTIPDNAAVPKNSSYEETVLDYFARIDKIDDEPPVISNFRIENITRTSAEVRWTTNEPATTQLLYGETTNYGNATPFDASLKTEHFVVVTNLTEGRKYFVKAISTDASNNTRSYPSSLTELEKVYFETPSDTVDGEGGKKTETLSQYEVIRTIVYLAAAIFAGFAAVHAFRFVYRARKEREETRRRYMKRLTRPEREEKLNTLFRNGMISEKLYTELKEKL